jgi:acyl-CoA reductase-like NAD-dependent aldehyde dehydrogenase
MVVEDSDRFRREIRREPVGVVFVIAPWNYPFLTAVNTIVPALIAGNAVVLKHAARPCWPANGWPKPWRRAACRRMCSRTSSLTTRRPRSLIAERSFGFVNFTGSVRGGQAIERAAAGTFTATGLELGGKDPGYVRADADLDAAVDGLMDGAMFNSGQCCCGIERIYVHESLYDASSKRPWPGSWAS